MTSDEANEDYKKLIKAVMDYSVTSYVKLQHPSNRKTKSLHQDFLITLDLFYDENYSFENFLHPDHHKKMNTKDMITFLLDGVIASMDATRKHIVTQAVDYWWDKNFHDIPVPEIITLAGKVWKVKNSPKNVFIDHENLRIYIPTKAKYSDRTFFKFVLEILLAESEIELTEVEFEKFHKLFYLLLKVNNAFN